VEFAQRERFPKDNTEEGEAALGSIERKLEKLCLPGIEVHTIPSSIARTGKRR